MIREQAHVTRSVTSKAWWTGDKHHILMTALAICLKLTPSSRVPSQKLTMHQTVMKIAAFCGHRRFITALTTAYQGCLSTGR